MSFFAELKRRNVFRVAVAYVIVAWLLIQVTSTVAPALHLPEWTLTFIVYLLIIGFPLALILAWIYELTPEGIKVTTSDGPSHYHTMTTGQRLNNFIIGVLVLVVAFLLVKVYMQKESPEVTGKTPGTAAVTKTVSSSKGTEEKAKPTTPSNSIAVLPFTDMSPNKDQDYFADGVAEEILNSLAGIKNLEVRGRTSSFYFKGKSEELTTISKMLNVEYVLEGSVRKAGDQVRITVQLINAVKDEHLWSKTYERTLKDIFSIQEEIAKSIANTLQISLGVGELGTAPGMTRNIDAYDAYLHGKELFLRSGGSSEDFTRAAQYYRQAVNLDPNFLRAWGGLYDVLEEILIYVPDQIAETQQEMEQVRKSLAKRSPGSPTYLAIMAFYYSDERKWQESEAAYDALVHGNIFSTPDYNQPASNYFLLNIGHVKEAIPRILRGSINDPLSLTSSYITQIVLYVAGRHEEAEKEYQRGLTLEGDHFLITQVAFLNDHFRKDLSSDELRARSEQNLARYSDKMLPIHREVLSASDNKQKLDILHRAINDSENQKAINMENIAEHASILGDTELALVALRRSYVDYKGTNLGMIWNPNFRSARKEPGFKDIVRDLGLVDYWRTTGNWSDFCHPVGEDDFECN